MEEIKSRDEFQSEDFDAFIIKDNAYKRKRRLKCFLIIIPILLIIIALTIALILILKYRGGTLICTYITLNDNESVKLLNDKIYEKYTLSIKQNEKSIDNNNTYTFDKAGNHTLTFEFKQKIESLENFFEGIDKLYEVDLSKLIFEDNININAHGLFKNCINLKKININININNRLENAAEMCSNCISLENIDFLKDLDTSNVLNMSSMFSGCSSLNLQNISIETNKVKDISKMFYNCIYLTTINNLNLITSEIIDFSEMFAQCEKLRYVNMTKLDTSKAKYLKNIFSGCISLTSVDFSNFNTSNVIDMSGLFSDCRNLETIDLSKFETNKVTDMSGMFSNCEKLTSLDISNFNTENLIEIEEFLFNCINLKNIIFGDKFILNKVEDMSFMFANCEKLTGIKLGKDKPNTFANLKTIQNICYGCTKLEYFDFNIDENNNNTFLNIIDMSFAFADCINLKEIKLININTKNEINMNSMFLNCESLINVNFSNFSIYKKSTNIFNMHKTFKNCKNLKEINLSLLNLSTSYDFTETFSGCTSLVNISFKEQSFKYSYYMDKMFYNCTNLVSIDLPLNLNNLIHAQNIFENCINLKNINLINMKNSNKLRNISGMFKNCTSLEELKFNLMTKYLINMDEMFYGCDNLKSIDFANFNTDRIKNMDKMFYNCSSLKFLDISKFEISENISIKDIFSGIEQHSVNVNYNGEKIFDNLKNEIKNIIVVNNNNK